MQAIDLADRLERAITGPMWHGPALSQLLKNVTAAEALSHPITGAHSIAELVEHVAVWAEIAHQRLAGRAASEPSDSEDWPAVPAFDEAGWQHRTEHMAGSYRSLAVSARELSADRLASLVSGQKYSLADMLQGVVEHGTYHGGQIAILRRALHGAGLPSR